MSRQIKRSVINFNQFKRESTNAAFERGVDLFVEGVEEEDLPTHTVGLNKIDTKAVRAGFIAAEVSAILVA